MGFFKKATVFLILGSAVSPYAWANRLATVVRDVVYTPDGEAFAGSVLIAPAQSPGPLVSVPVEDGMLSVRLPASESENALYHVTFRGSGGSTWTETWHIPAKDHVSLKDVRESDAASTQKDISLPIPISGIAGLPAALGNINSSLASLTTSINNLSLVAQNMMSQQSVQGEVPSGVLDGSNFAFMLANPPSPANSLFLYKNGQRQLPGSDFLLSGNVIRFVGLAVPKPGDTISADYTVSASAQKGIPLLELRAITLPIPMSDVSGLPSALSQINNSITNITSTVNGLNANMQTLTSSSAVAGETPTGTIDGSNGTFTLSAMPYSSPAVFRNGLRQTLGADYTISGATIIFSSSAIPQTGDTLIVDYTTHTAKSLASRGVLVR